MPDSHDEYGRTALYAAAERGGIKWIVARIECGDDLNEQSPLASLAVSLEQLARDEGLSQFDLVGDDDPARVPD